MFKKSIKNNTISTIYTYLSKTHAAVTIFAACFTSLECSKTIATASAVFLKNLSQHQKMKNDPEIILQHSPLARGRKELVNHLSGKKITRSQSMAAKCYDCMGHYKDGKIDCRMNHCPLYPWMPFRDKHTSTDETTTSTTTTATAKQETAVQCSDQTGDQPKPDGDEWEQLESSEK